MPKPETLQLPFAVRNPHGFICARVNSPQLAAALVTALGCDACVEYEQPRNSPQPPLVPLVAALGGTPVVTVWAGGTDDYDRAHCDSGDGSTWGPDGAAREIAASIVTTLQAFYEAARLDAPIRLTMSESERAMADAYKRPQRGGKR